MTQAPKTGILLMNLGGPDTLDAVEPFLYNLFSDPEIIQFFGVRFLQKPLARMISFFRKNSVANYYRQMGGGSPILPLTKAQAKALELALQAEGYPITAYIGMRYWHPFTEDTVDKMLADGIEHLIVVPLYPQYSLTTTGSSMNELRRILAQRQRKIKVSVIPPYYNHPDYQAAIADTIEQTLRNNSWSCQQDEVMVLFSAHSLPESFVQKTKDPYPQQIVETAKQVMETYFPNHRWELSYQSRVGPIPWLSP
jgi:protoporphyrin/coproporphyrin ferrochelatase